MNEGGQDKSLLEMSGDQDSSLVVYTAAMSIETLRITFVVVFLAIKTVTDE